MFAARRLCGLPDSWLAHLSYCHLARKQACTPRSSRHPFAPCRAPLGCRFDHTRPFPSLPVVIGGMFGWRHMRPSGPAASCINYTACPPRTARAGRIFHSRGIALRRSGGCRSCRTWQGSGRHRPARTVPVPSRAPSSCPFCPSRAQGGGGRREVVGTRPGANHITLA